MIDYPKFSSSSTGPAGLRFSEIVQVGSGEDATLVGLTPEGKLYEREFDEGLQILVWQPAPAFSSTELVQDLTLLGLRTRVPEGLPSRALPRLPQRDAASEG